MSTRYKIISDWVTMDQIEVKPSDFDEGRDSVMIILEAADIKDTRGGYEYSYGCYRVRSFFTDSGRSYVRTKRFYGETAQNSSQRMFDDTLFKARRRHS